MIPVILSTVARVAPSLAGSTGTAAASTSSASLSSSLQAMKGAGNAGSYFQKLGLGSNGNQFTNLLRSADLGPNPTGGGIGPNPGGGGPTSWTTYSPPQPPNLPGGSGSGGGGGNGNGGGGSGGGDWKDKFDQLGNWSEKAAQGVGMLAKNDWRGLVDSFAPIPPGMKKVIGALDDASEALIARGKELKNLDGNLATASAQADQRKLMADLREANRTGESVGNLIDTKSRIETKLQDAMAPIKEGLAKILNQMLTAIEKSGILEALQVLGELIGTSLSNLSDMMDLRFDKIADRILDLPDRIAQAIFGNKDEEKDFLKQIWDNTDKLNQWEGNRGEAPRLGDGRMGLGLFDGV